MSDKGPLRLPAYAKLNLTLEVLGRRSDGYHEVSTLLQTISLCDEVLLEPASDITLASELPGVPREQDLAFQAAMLLKQASGSPQGVRITVVKGIPITAGLGGGSSDAAAVLVGLNRLWELKWPQAKLVDLAARLGSDVPFFIFGGTAFAHSRGEGITPLPPLPAHWLVVLPASWPLPNKTATMYQSLPPSDYSDGQHTARAIEMAHLRRLVPPHLHFNAFERIALQVFPELSSFKERFLAAGAESVHLAGGGPSLYCVVDSEATGEVLRDRLRLKGIEAFVAHTISP